MKSHVKGGLYTTWTFEGKMASVLEQHNLVCPKFCHEPELYREGLPDLGGWGQWMSHEKEVSVKHGRMWEDWSPPTATPLSH